MPISRKNPQTKYHEAITRFKRAISTKADKVEMVTYSSKISLRRSEYEMLIAQCKKNPIPKSELFLALFYSI